MKVKPGDRFLPRTTASGKVQRRHVRANAMEDKKQGKWP